jgi:hypothetical protein
MANTTGAFYAVPQAIDAFVPTLHVPFPVLRCTLENCEDFVNWSLTHASQQAEMLMLNVALNREEAAWGEY